MEESDQLTLTTARGVTKLVRPSLDKLPQYIGQANAESTLKYTYVGNIDSSNADSVHAALCAFVVNCVVPFHLPHALDRRLHAHLCQLVALAPGLAILAGV